jgi:hypothetical protein
MPGQPKPNFECVRVYYRTRAGKQAGQEDIDQQAYLRWLYNRDLLRGAFEIEQVFLGV